MKFLRQLCKNIVIAVIVFGILIIGFAWFFQENLIHYPTKYTVKELELFSKQRPDLKFWPDKSDYRGIIAEPPANKKILGTVVMFHGNAGSVIERIWYADSLSALGYRVILHEHPGYGARDGKLDEKNLVNDGVESVRFARIKYGRPVYIVGESLGSGVAAGVISQAESEGAALIVPWDRIVNVAKKFYWYLPVELLLKEKYDSIENLKAFKGPLAVVMAENDEIIPPECSRNLYESFGGKKKLWISKGAGHNSWSSIATPIFWKDIMGFVSGSENNIQAEK
ncbi:alpha/beta hydrolase [Desulforegula conservatrix]|uniref:alpha/beta hydrolase n=1 Tax=Desulforegula conservatrix TaxID=153026 RepID=UPI0003FF87ED|nr:alpha/beta hydrolase [Desulforegula conservatrix]